jgi:ParB/RepB/Spo0J family partition protein
MSDKPKPKPSTSSAIRNAMRQRREPPPDLQEAPRIGLIESLNSQDLALQSSEQAVQPLPEQGEQSPPNEAHQEPTAKQGLVVTIAISKIRPGRYQKRETVDPKLYQQLKDQIKDFGLNFVAVLCRDPDDPNFYNLMMGGHLRLQAAEELGTTEVQAIVREYDRTDLMKGTYFENNGRQPLSMVDEGLFFKQCQDDEGWSQEEIAKKLLVPGGRNRVALCLLAAKASADVQEMLRKEPKRGQRCFTYLSRLDVLGEEKAIELRMPLIQDFLLGELSTDDVKDKVEEILQNEMGADREADTAGKKKTTTLVKGFDHFIHKIGQRPLRSDERQDLLDVRRKIDDLLENN